MKKLLQTRFHNPPDVKGNCFPTVIACFMDCESAEDVLQIQEKMIPGDASWVSEIDDWITSKGYNWETVKGHQFDGSYYIVCGKTERFPNILHCCIYQNGKLYHDPHPEGNGLITEELFETITKL